MGTRIVILGGGMLGMLAKTLFPQAMVLDWRLPPSKPSRYNPQMYGAMYLWEPLEGFSCAPITVETMIDGQIATYRSAALYKEKIGKPDDMHSPTWERQFSPFKTGWILNTKHWIDPTAIQYETFIDAINLYTHSPHLLVHRRRETFLIEFDVIISTIPLSHLAKMVGYDVEWRNSPIGIHVSPFPLDEEKPNADIRVNYLSSRSIPAYRTTDRDGLRHAEWLTAKEKGAPIATKILHPGKIWPNPRAEEILAMCRTYHIYGVGRYGSWNPEELTHQTYAVLRNLKYTLGE